MRSIETRPACRDTGEVTVAWKSVMASGAESAISAIKAIKGAEALTIGVAFWMLSLQVAQAAAPAAFSTGSSAVASVTMAAGASPKHDSANGSVSDQLALRIAAQLAQQPIVRADYVQTQTRAALRRPLLSSGELLFSRDDGIVWRIASPLQAVYAITDGGVRDVTAQTPADTRKVPARFAQVSEMMRGILGGDVSALYHQFDVAADGDLAAWHLRLVPNQPQIAQVLKQIDLRGGRFLTALRIEQTNGDTSEWTFSNAQSLASLPAAERGWLHVP